MVQLLAGIISLRRALEANPGRSNGNADTLRLHHVSQSIVCYQSTWYLYLIEKSTWCTWCHPSTVNTCTCKFEKYLYLRLKYFWNYLTPTLSDTSTLYQRCVVRGIALSSLLSCWLLANLNSRGSSVAPTWAHLCWPGSRSVHGSIHLCAIGWPHFAWQATRSIVSDVSPGHAGHRAWTRASESSQPAAQTSCPEPARRVSFAWVRR